MDEQTLLNSVHLLALSPGGELRCSARGHGAGHSCWTGSGEARLAPLVEAFSGRYGPPRSLATDGTTDPAVTEQLGLPLLEPFRGGVREMRAWQQGGSWIGCGEVETGEGRRVVVIVAAAPPVLPSPAPPASPVASAAPSAAPSAAEGEAAGQGESWLDRLVALTGHPAGRAHPVDWAAAEQRLGSGLPADYKDMAETFGHGSFDGRIGLAVPGEPSEDGDLVGDALRIAERAGAEGRSRWEPYQPYPAPGGLLRWASTDGEDEFFWLTGSPDPDAWPVLACGGEGGWSRFDGSTTEYVHRLLTDPALPHSAAPRTGTHWFQPYDGPDCGPQGGPHGRTAG